MNTEYAEFNYTNDSLTNTKERNTMMTTTKSRSHKKKIPTAILMTCRKESNAASREELVRELAYLFAESHGFTSNPVQDWLAAERVVDGKF
jgi:hypothetical protein